MLECLPLGPVVKTTIFADETDLRIDEAVLMMDYAYAQVPEPIERPT